jgi:hypothetical protein
MGSNEAQENASMQRVIRGAAHPESEKDRIRPRAGRYLTKRVK